MALGKMEYMDEIFRLCDGTPVNREALRGRLRKIARTNCGSLVVRRGRCVLLKRIGTRDRQKKS